MYRKFFKRLFDLLLAMAFLPLFIMLTIIVGLAIKLNDKGPIFYLGVRLGKHGKIFKMLKYRSMVVNAPDIRLEDGSTYNAEDDSRQTRVGKFLRKTSLDEIPQLINIIRGEMSFIGPRPDTVDSYDGYLEHEKERLSILPGITGYSQAFYRNSINAKEKINSDLYYVQNMTMWLDIKIILKTILILFSKEKVFISSSHETHYMN